MNPKHKGQVVSIVVVDDQPLTGQLLTTLLETLPGVAACRYCADLREAFDAGLEAKPDLIIADLAPANGEGPRWIRRVSKSGGVYRVAVLTGREDGAFARQCLQAGAVGYISKREPVARVTEAIMRILAGGQYISPQVTLAVSLEHITTKPLGDRERQVFDLIGHGHSTEAIATQLKSSRSTIQTHRRRIKKKLQIPTHADLIRRATRYVENGY